MLLLLVGSAPGAVAVRLETQAGWSGWVPLGVWIPLKVNLASTEPLDADIIVDAPLPGHDGVMSFRQPVRVGSESTRITMDILLPDGRRPATVRLVTAGRELARSEIRVAPGRVVDGVVMALTRDAAGLEFLAESTRKLRPAYITEPDLPTRWQGYGGIVLLAIRDLDPGAISPAQREAIEQWVLQGGRMVVTGGERLASLRSPWLLRMLPAVPGAVKQTQDLSSPRGIRGPVLAASLALKPGASSRGPLMAQWRWGAGVVTVWGFDAFAPEIRSLPGRAAAWREALDAPVRPAVATQDLAAALPVSRPLPGELQAGLAGLSLVYVIAARAALVRAGRVRSGWLAVPAVAAVFALALYGFALSSRRIGTSVVQAAVVEVIPGTGRARVSSFVSLISPYGGAFALDAPHDAAVRPVGPASLIFEGPSAIRGNAPASGLKVEAQQLVALAVDGAVEAGPAGLRLGISNRTGSEILDALVFRNGQVFRLPRIGPQFSAQLDPAGWVEAARRLAPPPGTEDRFIDEVLVRLRGRTSPDAGAWLVGRITDDRLIMRGQPMQVESYQILVLPLPLIKERP